MLEMRVIESAETEWLGTIVIDPKKNGSLRFFVNYRKINAVTEHSSYPICIMKECIDPLGDALIFSKLDANYTNCQAEIERMIAKNVISAHKAFVLILLRTIRTWQCPWNVQTGNGRHFVISKRAVHLGIFEGLHQFSETAELHIKHVRTRLSLLHRVGLMMISKKCKFFPKRLTIWDMRYPRQLELLSHTIDALQDLKNFGE